MNRLHLSLDISVIYLFYIYLYETVIGCFVVVIISCIWTVRNTIYVFSEARWPQQDTNPVPLDHTCNKLPSTITTAGLEPGTSESHYQ